MKVMTVVGTRPEFVQIKPLTEELRKSHQEVLVNTGQHYDDNMSQQFFRELDLPQPNYTLGIGSSSHGTQTGEMMIRLEQIVLDEKPDWVVVYGDTNSTVAGALVAAKMNIPLAHIEAGLRSYDRTMPEEVNRVITDHISNILLAPTETAVINLKNEGITQGVHLVGDVRVDVLRDVRQRVSGRIETFYAKTGLNSQTDFALATIHRASNTDTPEQLQRIINTFNIASIPIILPIHPRLASRLGQFGLEFGDNVHIIDPVGFLDMVALLEACRIVITDSGGLQKEAYMLKRPCVTVRDTTEWVETVNSGWNRLSEPDPIPFKAAVDAALTISPPTHPDFYGSPGVSGRIVDLLVSNS